MRRRGNGEGSVRKRPDGRWEARIRLPGGQRKHLYGETRQDAVKALQAFQHKLEQGTPVVASKLTVSQYLTEWLEGCKPPTLEYQTWRVYEIYIRVHIIPSLGTTKLVQLSPQQLQRFYAEKLAGGKSSTYVRHIHATIHKALDDAQRFGLVERNVAELVKAPPMGKRPMHVYTPEQVRQFLAAARGTRLEALYVLALSTGMRIGELLGLKWRDVDLEHGVVQVQSTLKLAPGGGRVVGKPKTSSSRRKVMLTTTAITALHAHQERQYQEKLQAGSAWQESGLVFTNTVGNALDPTNVYKYQYRPLIRQAGLPLIRLHDLRHSAATLLLLAGIHPKVVSELLGHSSINITLNLYSHVLPDMQAGATTAMERLIGEGEATEK